MDVNALQFVLLVLLAGFRAVDAYSTQAIPFMHALVCWLAGIILGDPNTGLIVGGTIQLMSMGAAGLGGSSAPDYGMAGMVATVTACITGNGDISVGLAIGVVVAMLYVQLDVIFKIYNSWSSRSFAAMPSSASTTRCSPRASFRTCGSSSRALCP